MSAVRSEDNRVAAARGTGKDGTPTVRNQDRPSPAVRKMHIFQSGMQTSYAGLEARDKSCGLPRIDIDFRKFAPIIQMHQSTAKYDPASRQESAPQIRKIHRVKRHPGCQAQLPNLRFA